MKKALLLAVVLIMGYSANCFAAAAALCTTATDGTYLIGTTTNHQLTNVKPSANVRLSFGSTVQTINGTVTGISYSLGAYHSSGTFTYATSSGDTNIYRFPKDETNNTFQLPPDSPTTATSGSTWTGWTASK